MNTGTVAQLPVAAVEAIADKARGGNRNTTGEDADGGNFLDLVARLGQDQSRRDGGKAAFAGDAGERGAFNFGAWLPTDTEVPTGGDIGASRNNAQALGQWDALGLQLALAGVGDVEALAQLLARSAGPGQAAEAAAVATRVANSTASEADIAMVRAALAAAANGQKPSIPDATMLASLAKAASQADARRAGPPVPETMAKLSVVGRETHLAPVPVAAMDGQHAQAVRARPSGDVADVALQAGDAKPDAQLAGAQPAVAPARDARRGPQSRPDGSPSSLPQQALPDAAAGDDWLEAGTAFQAASAVHADGPVNAGATASAVQQIASRIATEASTMLGQAVRAEAPAPGLGQRLGSAVKVIHLELQPDGLGAVSIRLAVKDQALHLSLEVGRGDTASLIQRDRDTLSGLLRSAGYLVDGVDVRMAGPSGLAPAPADGQSATQMSAGGQSRGSQPEDRPSGAGGQDNSKGSNPGSRHQGEDDQIGRNRGRGGGLYV
jgi:hypothetical protein